MPDVTAHMARIFDTPLVLERVKRVEVIYRPAYATAVSNGHSS